MKYENIKISDIKSVDGWRHAEHPDIKHITVQMYISRICNHSCPYCTHKDNTEKYKTFEEYIELMDLIYDATSEFDQIDFSFFGGEPTIVPRFNEIVDHVLTNYDNAYVTITSNASQPLEWWKTLEKWKGRIHCFISYQYNSVKNLEEYIEKIHWLYDNGFLYYLAVMLENEDEEKIKDVIHRFSDDPKISKKLTYASIDFNFNEKYSDIKEQFGHLEYRNVLQDQEYALKVELKDKNTIYFNDHMSFKTLGLHKFKYFRCFAGSEHILLDSNGDIYVCLSHILSDRPPKGNIYSNNKLKEIISEKGIICTFDECVSELWIKKERIANI